VAPSCGPLKTGGLQGKRRRARGSAPFGGRNGHIWVMADARSTAPTGAWPSPTGCDEGRESHPLRTLLIAANRMVKPSIEGCGNGACLGAEMGVSASSLLFFLDGAKYCRNGAWLSPTGCDEGRDSGRDSHPLRTLLIAANRMDKPSIEGCGKKRSLGRRWAGLPQGRDRLLPRRRGRRGEGPRGHPGRPRSARRRSRLGKPPLSRRPRPSRLPSGHGRAA